MPEAMASHPRLYAYPARPEPGTFVLLDSGAYGLSQQARHIGLSHTRIAEADLVNGHKLASPVENWRL